MLTEVDSERYEAAVLYELQSFVFPEEVTEEEVAEKYESIRFEQLHPYMVEEDMPDEGDPGSGGRPAFAAITTDSSRPAKSRLFPNPTTREVTVRPSSRFREDEEVLLIVVDMTGRAVAEYRVDAGARQKILPTVDLPGATFMLFLKQAEHQEVLRFTKIAE